MEIKVICSIRLSEKKCSKLWSKDQSITSPVTVTRGIQWKIDYNENDILRTTKPNIFITDLNKLFIQNIREC